MSRGPTLTYLLIGVACFIAVILLLFSGYSQFMTDNSKIIDSSITSAYNNFTAEQGVLDNFNKNLTAKSTPATLFQSLINMPANIFTVAVIGFDAISKLATLPQLISDINGMLRQGIPFVPEVIWWLIEIIASIYVISMFIKAVRGNVEEP